MRSGRCRRHSRSLCRRTAATVGPCRAPRAGKSPASASAPVAAGAPEDAPNDRPWAAGIRTHLERRGWTQGELASRSSLKPNTVGAVLRGDATSTRTPTAIAAGFGVEVVGRFNGGAPEPADLWAAALEHLETARRTLAEANVDATPRSEADSGRGGRRAGGPSGAPGAGSDRRACGGSPDPAGAVRVRPGRGTLRVLTSTRRGLRLRGPRGVRGSRRAENIVGGRLAQGSGSGVNGFVQLRQTSKNRGHAVAARHLPRHLPGDPGDAGSGSRRTSSGSDRGRELAVEPEARVVRGRVLRMYTEQAVHFVRIANPTRVRTRTRVPTRAGASRRRLAPLAP